MTVGKASIEIKYKNTVNKADVFMAVLTLILIPSIFLLAVTE